eukprot:TRINITY_DN2438_c0_g1_i1.p1 TRINITY_DN2438_c0_g1~~TRINITY_DN2438_c0_g1_i1.p1  ORF type:complete len:287 (-),score=77.80 TRINITY_DN2438_c0_g1_i1:108-968(-)
MKMKSEINYHERSHYYSTKYMRSSKAVGVLWGIFTMCYTILAIVVFMQDQWIGDADNSKGPGNFGTWRWCTDSQDGREICRGRLDDFGTILSPAFRAATVFTGLAVIISILCVVALVLFFMCRSSDVFKICGTMQYLSGLCLGIGILSFPAGWDNDEVRGVCGPEADDFNLGTCGIRWAFVLAVIAFFDSIILGCLAFTLATKKLKFLEEPAYMNPSSMYQGEINPGFMGDNMSLTGSRKSGGLQPVMLMPHGPQDDRYSEYSHPANRSSQSPFRTGPQVQHNFQL